MKREIIDFICAYFVSLGKFSSSDSESYLTKNFIDLKLLDSIQFITLIADVEEHYNIAFTEDEMQSDIFSTIDGIAELAYQKLN